jgi:hypothetical protein
MATLPNRHYEARRFAVCDLVGLVCRSRRRLTIFVFRALRLILLHSHDAQSLAAVPRPKGLMICAGRRIKAEAFP